MVETNTAYVDKTWFIHDFMQSSYSHFLITRPRRFGKSHAWSLLYHFLDMGFNTSKLFSGTNLAKHTSFCSQHQNQYSIIRLSFSGCSHKKTWKETRLAIISALGNALEDYAYLFLENPGISNGEFEFRKEWFMNVLNVSPTLNDGILTFVIVDLSSYLSEYLNKPVVIIIDEYDVPFHAAYHNGYYDDVVGFMSSFYEKTLKGNGFLRKSLMIGTSRVLDAKLNTGLNHYLSCSVVDDCFSEYFGFTKEETEELILKAELPKNLINSVIEYYDGYCIGGRKLLNPWSVRRCLDNHGQLGHFWTYSSQINNFPQLMKEGGLLAIFESELMVINITNEQFYESYLYYSLVKRQIGSFWSFLLDLGYVTAKKVVRAPSKLRVKCHIGIPNKEVSEAFTDVLRNYYRSVNITRYETWLEKTVKWEEKGIKKIMQQYLDNAYKEIELNQILVPDMYMKEFLRTLLMGLTKYYDETSVDVQDSSITVSLKGGLKDYPAKLKFEIIRTKESWTLLLKRLVPDEIAMQATPWATLRWKMKKLADATPYFLE